MDEGSAGFLGLVKRADRAYLRALRAVVLALAAVSGLAMFVMIGAICLDVILRLRWVSSMTGFTLVGDGLRDQLDPRKGNPSSPS